MLKTVITVVYTIFSFFFQKILSQSVVSVHIEIRPKYLVPDTNCFIDYLTMIKAVAEAHFYTLMVPLVGKY